MKFVSLNMVEPGAVRFDEDTGTEVRDESSKPVVVNAAAIRAFYARRDGKPGTRITFSDGGGFAVAESPAQIVQLVAGGDIPTLAITAPVSTDAPATDAPAAESPPADGPAPARRSRRAN
jgi:hypothetical protein